MNIHPHFKFKFTYTRIIATGFFIVILIGTFLLMLPISSRSGEWSGLGTSGFTAVSATCVTGLSVVDTYHYWSEFGHVVILLLIQIGGLGFMTMITMFSIFMRKHITLRERRLLMQSAGTIRLNGVITLIRKVLIGTFIFETAGALLLAIRFCPKMGLGKGIWYAVFHSISAYCNAGFDMMSQFGSASFSSYYSDPLVCITLMCLIVVGGLGFLVWSDVIKCRFRFKDMELHSKIVLTATALLIFGGTILFYISEQETFSKYSEGDKWLNSFFQSVTVRTAGFFSVDQSTLSDSGTVLSVVLMFIGGSPGSTAGGIKTTTFVVFIISSLVSARNNDNVVLFKRRIQNETVKQSCAIVCVYLMLVLTSVFFICIFEPYDLRDIVFESASAIGTVGLSTGITASLCPASKIILMGLMYTGRIGGLSMMLVLAEKSEKVPLVRPTEKILIG